MGEYKGTLKGYEPSIAKVLKMDPRRSSYVDKKPTIATLSIGEQIRDGVVKVVDSPIMKGFGFDGDVEGVDVEPKDKDKDKDN